MVYSMTGYGQSVRELGGFKVSIEIKSVNHRYCEAVLRLPREWTSHEDRLRRLVQQRVQRGRVDVFINKERNAEADREVDINLPMLEAYLHAAQVLRSQYGITGQLDVKEVLHLPDIVMIRESASWTEEQLAQCLNEGVQEALDGLCIMRAAEGNHLANDMLERLSKLELLHAELNQWAPLVVNDYRTKLKQRLEQVLDGNFPFDEHKFGMEVALFAERSNIDEELTRLTSHFQQFRQLLSSDEPIGRKLDFLIQEMNRETNTIGSKANHLELTNRVVDIKAELEKVREQAANIE
ncbi:YicC/YloC family endoribonuclease [Paenibacillus sp. 481]|uniref:YicC/YloC family endoribonuclease n=1 Tax=Paenibacillus sp. 481 TaxID=2835869 RepID=UPI001E40D6A1|nr:YicC/YloC family endoribonuclease [Paenibacillus sp. 481]UHA74041.1 YicC family protein [Paenibacillus sp. 481]